MPSRQSCQRALHSAAASAPEARINGTQHGVDPDPCKAKSQLGAEAHQCVVGAESGTQIHRPQLLQGPPSPYHVVFNF